MKLRQAAKFAAQDPRAQQALAASGTSFMFQYMNEFEKYVSTEAKDMAGLVQQIGWVDGGVLSTTLSRFPSFCTMHFF